METNNLDHKAIVQQELDREEAKREEISNKLRKEIEEEMKRDSFFVRKLKKDEEENQTSEFKINNRPNLSVITNDKPYKLEELMRLETKELAPKVRRVPKEKVNKYLAKQSKKKDEVNTRYDAIYQEALMYGTQSGLYYRGTQLKKFIEKYETFNNEYFNFTPLMMAKGKVVPPVIVESVDNQQSSDRYTLRRTDKSYRIAEQVKVVSSPINWRNFLMIEMPKPNIPNEMLLPLNEDEDHHWKVGISQGWEVGVGQANAIYLQNIRKLERDYVGMVRSHIMLKGNMITDPVTSTTTLGVTGDIDETMNVNETIFKIDRQTQFNIDANSWKMLDELPSVIE